MITAEYMSGAEETMFITLNGPLWNDQIFTYECFGALLVLKKDISNLSKALRGSTTFVICMILV